MLDLDINIDYENTIISRVSNEMIRRDHHFF